MKLTRSTDKVIAGVCGGLAEYFRIDASIVRIVYLLIAILSAAFPGILVYLVLWIAMPAPAQKSTLDADLPRRDEGL